MPATRMKYAELNEAELRKVQLLEDQLGGVVVVMERLFPPARLEEAQLERLRSLEQELGVTLVAYNLS